MSALYPGCVGGEKWLVSTDSTGVIIPTKMWDSVAEEQ